MDNTRRHKTKRARIIMIVLTVVLYVGIVFAEDPVPQAWLDMRPVSVWRSGQMTATVIVEWTGAPDSMVVLPVEMPDIEGVVWSDQTISTEFDGDLCRTVQNVVLTASERTGTIEIPEIRVQYRLHGEEKDREVMVAPTNITIKSFTVSARASIVIFAVAVVAGSVWLGMKVRSVRRDAEIAGECDDDESDRLEQDLAALSRLKLAGDYGAYFMGLIRIAREVDPEAVEQAPLSEVSQLVDSARYGGYRPDDDLADRSFRAVERLIKKSRSVQISEGG